MRWINDGMVEIVRRNDNALQETTTINLVANQASYSLPADMLILRSLRYKYTSMQSYSALKYLSMQQFDEYIDGWDGTYFTAGTPVVFTTYEDAATLFPTPDQASVNGLKILYNKKPTDVTTLADTLSLPLLYHNALVQYCMWQASLLDEDHEPGMMYQSNFGSNLQELMNKENRGPSATYPVITTLAEDM